MVETRYAGLGHFIGPIFDPANIRYFVNYCFVDLAAKYNAQFANVLFSSDVRWKVFFQLVNLMRSLLYEPIIILVV